MVQLFFQLNRQQFRNKKYKSKYNKPKDGPERGHSANTALDSIEASTYNLPLGQSDSTIMYVLTLHSITACD